MKDWVDIARARMLERGLRQQDLMEPLGVTTRGAVGHYLNRRREPTLEQMQALAAALGLRMDELFGSRTTPHVGEERAVYRADPQRQAMMDLWEKLTPENRKTLATVGHALAKQDLAKARS